MTDHTPGPWTYTDERMPNDDARGFWVAAPGSWHVAEVLNEADARLIAAAPDLLAFTADATQALEDIETLLTAGKNVNHGNIIRLVREGRAAIAKAKPEVSVDE